MIRILLRKKNARVRGGRCDKHNYYTEGAQPQRGMLFMTALNNGLNEPYNYTARTEYNVVHFCAVQSKTTTSNGQFLRFYEERECKTVNLRRRIHSSEQKSK